MIQLLIVTSVLQLSSVHAADESAADALLQSFAPSGQAPSGDMTAAPSFQAINDDIKLTNPVARAVFTAWNSQQGFSFETSAWIRGFLSEKFEPTAHLWTVMSKSVPVNFYPYAQAAYLYSLYRTGVSQTFITSWFDALSSQDFLNSKAAAALEESMSADFDQVLAKKRIRFSVAEIESIKKIGFLRSPVFLTLNAVAALRTGSAALPLLEKLPLKHAYRPLLAKTAALDFARKGDLAKAAQVFKIYYEPWVVAMGEPRNLARHYLQMARLLYQAGSLEGAEHFYLKVPNGIPEFITAQEELGWVWLRTGKVDRLRGSLATLTSKTLSGTFRPEAYLVRSISNLKFCFYSDVEKDFAEFESENRDWAKKIDDAIALSGTTDVPAPRELDDFSLAAKEAVDEKELELKQLGELRDRSISAVLPAVGPQKHWNESIARIQVALEEAKKNRSLEFARQWKNDQATLAEAIKKMKFVRIELLSQARLLVTTDTITTGQAAPLKVAAADHEQVYPFDGVIWPDELFKLRSLVRGKCAGQ